MRTNPKTTVDMSDIHPTHIAVHQQSRVFEIHFSDGSEYSLPMEYLRVFSPSAEARVARQRGELIRGKQQVNVLKVEPMGAYAVRIVFDDGHDSGVYSWTTLKQLGENFESNWRQYQQDLVALTQSPHAQQKVKVLLFMTLAEKLGMDDFELELPGGEVRVGDVIEDLRERGDEWREVLNPDRLTITVNKQFVDTGQLLFAGDEIAFVPKA